MYQAMCLLSGVILAIVITTNGSLTGVYGPYIGAVIIHIVGTVVAFVVMKAARQGWKPQKKIGLWMYCGGLIGILTTVFQGVAFGEIGVTAILALGLFGQTTTSLVVDTFGLFGMERRAASKETAAGVLVSLCGIGYMLLNAGDVKLYAYLMAIASGVSGVVSRLVNARLAGYTSPLGSSFINHWVGLLGSVVLLLMVQPDFLSGLQMPVAPLWVYLGGAWGVFMIVLWNIAGPKVSAFQLTLLSFVGQVFTGIFIDWMLGDGFSQQTFIGGGFVVIGVLLNMLAERKRSSLDE